MKLHTLILSCLFAIHGRLFFLKARFFHVLSIVEANTIEEAYPLGNPLSRFKYNREEQIEFRRE